MDVFSGKVKDMHAEGIIEPLRVKKQAVSSASEVAAMVLRIDDVIAANPLKLPTPAEMASQMAKGKLPGGKIFFIFIVETIQIFHIMK